MKNKHNLCTNKRLVKNKQLSKKSSSCEEDFFCEFPCFCILSAQNFLLVRLLRKCAECRRFSVCPKPVGNTHTFWICRIGRRRQANACCSGCNSNVWQRVCSSGNGKREKLSVVVKQGNLSFWVSVLPIFPDSVVCKRLKEQQRKTNVLLPFACNGADDLSLYAAFWRFYDENSPFVN